MVSKPFGPKGQVVKGLKTTQSLKTELRIKVEIIKFLAEYTHAKMASHKIETYYVK